MIICKPHNVFFCLSIILLFSTLVFPQNAIGIWQNLQSADGSLPAKRHEAAFVVVGKKFYSLGGRGLKPVDIFDNETRKWSQGKKPPLQIHHFQAVTVGKKIYVVGAMTGQFPAETPIPNFYIYETEKDEWTVGPEIPAERLRGSTGTVFYKDKIYLVCGIKDGHRSDHKKWLDVYDLKTKKWEILPDAPRPRDHFQAVFADDKIFVLGGRLSQAPTKTFSETIAEIDVFDLKKKKWTTLAEPIPTKRAGNAAVYFDQEILVIGGESMTQPSAHSEVEALNIRSGKWRKMSPMLQGRHGIGSFVFNNQVFVVAGNAKRGGGAELDTLEFLSFKE